MGLLAGGLGQASWDHRCLSGEQSHLPSDQRDQEFPEVTWGLWGHEHEWARAFARIALKEVIGGRLCSKPPLRSRHPHRQHNIIIAQLTFPPP